MLRRDATLDLYVLDTLADDIEDLATILRVLNSDELISWYREWGRSFHREEVVESLTWLITNDFVRVLVPSADGQDLEDIPSQATSAWGLRRRLVRVDSPRSRGAFDLGTGHGQLVSRCPSARAPVHHAYPPVLHAPDRDHAADVAAGTKE